MARFRLGCAAAPAADAATIRYNTISHSLVVGTHELLTDDCAHCGRGPGLCTLFDPLLPPLVEALTVVIVVAAIVVVHAAVAIEGQREGQREGGVGAGAGVAGAGVGSLASSCVWS